MGENVPKIEMTGRRQINCAKMAKNLQKLKFRGVNTNFAKNGAATNGQIVPKWQ